MSGYQPRLMLPPPSYARRGGEIVAAQLRAVGIEPQIVNVEWAQWLEQVFKNKDYDLTIVSHTEPMDIEIYARPDYYFDAPDPVMRALWAGVQATADPDEQAALLKAAQQRVAANAVNVFLFQLAKTGVADARLARPLAELADPGQRHDRRELGRVMQDPVDRLAPAPGVGRDGAAIHFADLAETNPRAPACPRQARLRRARQAGARGLPADGTAPPPSASALARFGRRTGATRCVAPAGSGLA